MPLEQHPFRHGRQESHETVREIDAVIAWVDGSEAQHLASRLKHRGGLRRSTRFADSGEIYYCIASILKYAPFIRRIWIVSDAQSPKFLREFAKAGLCEPDFIQVVDHTALLSDFPEALPTFNSRTIEAVLWRIPGLSERFVYFNDDFFANRLLRP
jgi:Stealth protein CR2, conserved region 2/Stealth protein CR1, conserved region 1